MDNKETANRLKALIAANKHSEAIEEMLKMVEAKGGEGEDGLLILKGRKHRLEEQILKGTIGKEQEDLESNRITETLLTYADKIGKGEKTTFAASLKSKEILEHDKAIFFKSDKVANYQFLFNIVVELTEKNTIKNSTKYGLEQFAMFLDDPSNEFLTPSIATCSNNLVEAIDRLSLFMKDTFFYIAQKPASKSDFTLFLGSPNTHRQLTKEVYQTRLDNLFEISNNILDSYIDFRKEVKHKLII
ncbi:MAG: hypothetical protein IPN76_27100 [Saprospiraceae bacterium]|nr:hypothetical protein [Saprospiraceae bacterium]